ncbi:MAG: DUF1186 domain-containing protein [Hyphomicrobiaceae bacterium]
MDKAEEGRRQLLELLGEAGIMPAAEVIADLTYREIGKRPAVPLATAIARPDEFKDRLLAVLSLSAAELDTRFAAARDDRHAYFLHTFAIYLLALWQDQRAFAPLVAYLAADSEAARDQLDDILTEDLHAILARVYDGSDLAPIKGIVENEAADPYVRSACAMALNAMARLGRIPEPEVVAYFEALAERLEREGDSDFRTLFAINLAHLQADVFRARLDRWLEEGLVDEAYLTSEDIDAIYDADFADLNEELTRRERFDGLIDYLCDWAWFNVSDPSELEWEGDETGDDEEFDEAGPIVREGRKIGRNEPCPCGSGKKYKKCCMESENG